MKIFIAFLAIALAAADAVYAPEPVSTSVWPPYGVYGKVAAHPSWPYGNNGWNSLSGWNSWDGQGHLGYPYANRAWSPAYGHNTVVQANLGKGYPYGLPWGTYGGAEPLGHKTVVQANLGHGYPYGLPWGTYGAEPLGHKTVVQANLGKSYPYGLPWGTYGAERQGWTGYGYNHGGYLPTVVPVSKQLAATPGSVHVADVPVGGEKQVYA